MRSKESQLSSNNCLQMARQHAVPPRGVKPLRPSDDPAVVIGKRHRQALRRVYVEDRVARAANLKSGCNKAQFTGRISNLTDDAAEQLRSTQLADCEPDSTIVGIVTAKTAVHDHRTRAVVRERV